MYFRHLSKQLQNSSLHLIYIMAYLFMLLIPRQMGGEQQNSYRVVQRTDIPTWHCFITYLCFQLSLLNSPNFHERISGWAQFCFRTPVVDCHVKLLCHENQIGFQNILSLSFAL